MSTGVLKQHPNRVPVIVGKAADAQDLADISKHKFLVPQDLQVFDFTLEIRKHIQLVSEKAIVLALGESGLPPPARANMGTIYQQYKDQDGFLYVFYAHN
jgi:GABA(A) receptor-associated protein